MLQHSISCSAIKKIPLLLTLLLFTTILPIKGTLQAAIQDHNDQLLQFTAGGHILGFQPDGLYVASGDHMLHIGFVGTAGKFPAAPNTNKVIGKAQHLTEITYTDLWPGVNLRYEAATGSISQSTWEIAPGADASQIRLRYNAPLEIATDGSLKIEYATGWIHESAPIAWQEINDRHHPVKVAFRLIPAPEDEQIVVFDVGAYNPSFPLLIDPTLTWNTFMGSTSTEYGMAMAVDKNGNVYIAGRGFATWGEPKSPYMGKGEVFVAKLNNNGVLQWNTFMGSAEFDSGEDIAVDDSGNVYVSGYSDATWGTPKNAHQGNNDAFAAKLDTNGILQWHTFMGSADDEAGNAITVDGSGNVYVVGSSGATWGSPVRPYTGNNDDVFATKLSSTGVRLWHTFLGSGNTDWGEAIAVDSNGNVYVGGESGDTWGTTTLINPHQGDLDAFVAKLSNNGVLTWNTFMGSTGADYCQTLTVDASGNVYIGGYCPSSWGTPKNAHQGGLDAFVAKLNNNGELTWNTFMGSASYDTNGGIAVDKNGNVYVAGRSDATWGVPKNIHAGPMDAFAAKLNSDGKRIWNTFMGSASHDHGNSIEVDDKGNIYLGGQSSATWGTPVNDYANSYDAFAAKFSPGDCSFFIFKSAAGKVIPVCL